MPHEEQSFWNLCLIGLGRCYRHAAPLFSSAPPRQREGAIHEAMIQNCQSHLAKGGFAALISTKCSSVLLSKDALRGEAGSLTAAGCRATRCREYGGSLNMKTKLKALKMNKTNFAKELGITQTAYSIIENGNNPLSDRYIKVICSCFNANENWLRTGDGDMFFSSPDEKEFTEIFSHLAPETQQYLLLMAKELLNIQ